VKVESDVAVKETRAFEMGALNPVEIIVGWEVLYRGLRLSGMYESPEAVRLLNDGLRGAIQIWLLKARMEDGTLEMLGILGTQIYHRPYSKVRALSLIHANAVEHIDDDEWAEVYRTLMAFAKREGCGVFEIFSDNPRVQELMEKFGFRQSGLYVREV
jgi:hypothetical protein